MLIVSLGLLSAYLHNVYDLNYFFILILLILLLINKHEYTFSFNKVKLFIYLKNTNYFLSVLHHLHKHT